MAVAVVEKKKKSIYNKRLEEQKMKKLEEYVRSIPDFPPLSTERKWDDRKGG